MRTRRCIHWLSISVSLTILALSLGTLASASYAQGGTADAAASTTVDEGGGTCDGCLDAATAVGDGQDNSSANLDFIAGKSPDSRDAGKPIPAPSTAVFALALLAIGIVTFFVRRWFAMAASNGPLTRVIANR